MTTVAQALNRAMHEALERDDRVLFLGEDILDPYGGAFKIAKGLSTRFPDRILTTPISEAAIAGIAAGLALRGFRPVAEIMFGDFLPLTFDQLLNHACKYAWMYNDQVRVPMTVRTPMGGRRGYGPTHSQSTEKWFLGVPGLQVVAANTVSDPQQLLLTCVLESDCPTVFIEHKALYPRPVRCRDQGGPFEIASLAEPATYPSVSVRLRGAPHPSVAILTYGYSVELVLDAILRLALEREVFAEALVPARLCPMHLEPFMDGISATRRLLTVEEGSVTAGWGDAVVGQITEACPRGSQVLVRRLGARDVPIPSSRVLEEAVLPSVEDVVNAVLQLHQA